MNSRSFFNPHKARVGSRLLGICCAGFGLLAGAPLPALADIPDWVTAAALQPLPSYSEETVAVVLLDEQVTTVKSADQIETRYRRVLRILRPQGKEKYGGVAVEFGNDTRLTYLKGWCISANGQSYEVKEKDAAEFGSGAAELYNDIRFKALEIPAAGPGSVIGYEYVRRKHPYFLQDVWWIQGSIPVRLARFTVRLPSSWEFDAKWANHNPVEPRSDGSNVFTWELSDLPAIEHEPFMPPMRAISARLAVRYFPPTPDGKSGSTWKAVGAWDAQLNVGRNQPTPEIQSKVNELAAGQGSILDKVRALAEFAQREVRYVAIEIGIGGYQPHFASDVFTHRYGDCKDKANLLRTMLGVIGVEAYPVLVHTQRGSVIPDFPAAMTFNHVITAIRLPPDVPESDLFALVNHPALGRLLIFDPTNSYVPVGYLPSYEQDSYGLLVTSDSGDLLHLPALVPAANRLSRTGKFVLHADGTLTGEVEELRRGDEAAEKRSDLLRMAPADRAKSIESFLGIFLSNFRLTKATIGNLEINNQFLVIRYEFTAPAYAKAAGNLVLVRPRVLGRKATDMVEKERKYPFNLGAESLHTDTFEIELPPGLVPDDLPQPTSAEYDFGKYKSETKLENNVLRYSRTFETRKVSVPLQQVPELKAFYRKIAADERSTAVLRHASP